MSAFSVSVIIPAYNCEAYLGPAIQSVLDQSLPAHEILVIDDGSTDGTAAVARAFGDRIRYARQDNRGVSAARNHGLGLAAGEWVGFLDADDIWEPEKLERQIERARQQPSAGMIYCGNVFVDRDNRPIPDYIRKIETYRGDAALDLFCDFFLLTSAVLVRRDVVARAGGFDENLRVGEDYDFFLRCLRMTRLECAQEPLLRRRVHPESLSRQDGMLDFQVELQILKRHLRLNPQWRRQSPERVRKRLAGYQFSYGYRCLEAGCNGRALRLFLATLLEEPAWRVWKNIVLCAVPLPLRRLFKRV